jgi:hypothetical protein
MASSASANFAIGKNLLTCPCHKAMHVIQFMLTYRKIPAPCQRVTLPPHATPIIREVCRTGVGKPDDEERHAMATLSRWRVVQVTCQGSYQVAMVEHMRPHRWLLKLTDTSRAKIVLLVETRRMDQRGTR